MFHNSSQYTIIVVVVWSLSHVWLSVTPWTIAQQASLSFTLSWSLLKLTATEPGMLSSHLILCHSSPFALNLSPVSQLFALNGQSIGASASASVLPMTIQGWFPLGLTGLISLQSKGFSRVFSNTTVWKHQFFGAQPSLWFSSHIYTLLVENP